MDFITGFPVVDRKGSVLVVVNRFSKYAIFLAALAHYSAEDATVLFLTSVVKYFGLLANIINDRDMRFTS